MRNMVMRPTLRPGADMAERPVDDDFAAVGRAARLGGRKHCRCSSPPATERPWPPSPEEVGCPHASLRAHGHPRPRPRGAHRRSRRSTSSSTVVRNDGGSVEKVDIWGRRRLSYEIAKKSEGIYAVVDLQAEPATVKELDRQLNLNEAVLRTKVLRPDQR